MITNGVPGIGAAALRYLRSHQQGRLATLDRDGNPQVKPVGYVVNPDQGTIDIAGLEMASSAKYRNIQARPAVSFVVDDVVAEGPAGTRFVEVRGQAEPAEVDRPPGSPLSPALIRVHPHRVISWNVDPDHPGLHTQDLGAGAEGPPASASRPAVGRPAPAARAARDAVAGLVRELQDGWDQRDAGITNRHFAADLLWGSPFGATVTGYDDLHAIHERLKRAGRGGPASRFEIVAVLAPAPDVVIAQVRRTALDQQGQPVPPSADLSGAFSELAMYVLVRRGTQWWLAAGQNTPVRPPPTD